MFTNKQLEVKDRFYKDLMNKCVNLLEEAQAARDAIVKLPHTNEEGMPVVHGNNLVMHSIQDCCMTQYQFLKSYLTHEQEVKLQQQFKRML